LRAAPTLRYAGESGGHELKVMEEYVNTIDRPLHDPFIGWLFHGETMSSKVAIALSGFTGPG
jgi:hypothetical protein